MERNCDTSIQFSGLKSGTYDFKFRLNDSFFSDYKNEKILGGDIIFDVRLEKTERVMMFFFSFEGEVRTTCDRCLGEMQWPVEGEETLCVKFGDNQESDDEDIVFLPENAFKMDLAQWMYEYVAVQMPIQTIHPADENGNPTCDPEMLSYLSDSETDATQAEPTTDPRWDALLKLKE